MSKKKNKQKSSGSSAKTLQKKLDKILILWDEDPIEAFSEVEELAINNPNFDEAWETYAEIATEQEFLPAAFNAHYHLLKLDSEDEDRIHNFALLCGAMAMPFTALYYATQYHELIGDSMIKRLDKIIDMFEPIASELRVENPHIADVPIQYLADMEIADKLLSINRFDEVREICEALKVALPDNPTPRNNLATLRVLEGDYETAYTLEHETLEIFPDNYFARCEFAQLLARLGRDQEAEDVYAPMRQNSSTQPAIWLKRFETLATMGKDAEIVEHYQSQEIQDLEIPSYGLHLIATAHARSGDEDTAKKIWRRAKRENPALELARENLINLDLLIGDKQDSWYFELQHWVPDIWLLQVEECFNKANTKERLQKLLESQPALQAVLPILLDRGELTGREFALDILRYCPSPIVVDFMNSNKGTEQNRVSAAFIAYKNNYVPQDQPIKMQIQGIVQELNLFHYDVFSDFVDQGISKHIQKLINKAHKLLNEDKDYKTALEIVQYARSMDPNERTLMNYHATALIGLGKTEEAHQIILETIEKHPDYMFPQMDLAREQIRDKNYEAVRQTLDKWSKEQRFHSSEFLVFVVTNVELFIAQKKFAKAKCWLYQARAIAPYLASKLNVYHGMIAFNSIPKGTMDSLLDVFSGE